MKYIVAPTNKRYGARAIPGLLCSCFLAFGVANAAPESHPMRFEHLTLDDGLSQSAVISVWQDSEGFMWFGTENGLNKYNGYEFEQFSRERGNPDALRNDFIYDIRHGEDGTLWLATNGGGLARFDRASGAFEAFQHNPADTNSIGGNVVRRILIDDTGAIWLGLRDMGVNRFDPKTKSFERFAVDALSADLGSIFALYQDRSGVIWVGGDNGLFRLHGSDGVMVSMADALPESASSIPTKVRAIHEDRNGTIWIGTYSSGLFRFDGSSGTFVQYRHDPLNTESISDDRVTSILEDRDGRLWIATSRGLNLLDADTGSFARYEHQVSDASSLGANEITTLFEDRSGMLWVGTLTAGLSKWNPRTWGLGLRDAADLVDDENAQPNVTAFATDASDVLWIGTFGDGLLALDRGNGGLTEYRHDPADATSLSDDRVMTLEMGRDGSLWIGTMTGGLNRLDIETSENTIYRHDSQDPSSLSADGIMSVFEDSRGRVWVGTFGGGISMLEPGAAAFKRYAADPETAGALSSSRVTSFAEDPSGMLWIGTDAGGLNLLDPQTGHFATFRYDAADPSSLADDTIYSLHVDAAGTVWVGTRGGGLDRVIGTATEPERIRFANVSRVDGLANDVIYGIRSDASGELWLSSNYGISRYNPGSGEIETLHRRDGLQSEEFNFGAHHRSASGELFFGGHKGFNIFRPEDLEANETIPPIVLTGFFKSNQRAGIDFDRVEDDGIELGYRDDNVSFEFAALDYTSPEHNSYMYKLEGFDTDWLHLGNQHRVTYTGLDRGSYLLRVRGANSDGTWNEAGFSLPLHVLPAPWETWWAYLGYVAVAIQLVLFLWLGHRRKLRREEEYSYRLEREVRDRTAELAERNDELNKVNKKLQESTLSDPLTGLRNRRFVFEEVSRDLVAIGRKHAHDEQGIDPAERAELCFMMIDLDNFKPINDTYGHAAGDQVLLEIRDVLLKTVRRSDFVVRWGGDEFVVIAKQSHAAECEALAERIRREIGERTFTLADGQVVRTTASIGFVAFPLYKGQSETASLDDVINLADSLMYEAKRQRNAWVGMLSINEAVTSEEFLLATLDPSSLLFRAQREGKIFEHRPEGEEGHDLPRLLEQAG